MGRDEPQGRGFTVTVEGAMVRLVVSGEITPPLGGAGLAEAMRVATEAGVSRLLFDMRGARHPGFHASVMKRASEAGSSGITRFRVAIVVDEGSPMLQFINDVANNRGLTRGRAFASEAEALAWLEGANPAG